MNKIGVIVVFLIIVGCVTPLKKGADNVRLTYNTSTVEGCEFRGEVKAKSRSGGTLNTDISEEDALNKLKNSAFELGANVVLMSREGVEKSAGFNPYAYGGVMLKAEYRSRGEAYFCDPNKGKEIVRATPTTSSTITIVQEPPPKPAAQVAKGPDAPYDFRKVTWGMSQMEVESVEVGQLLKKEANQVVYQSEMYGLDCAITYSFENDTLIRGTITFIEVHPDVNQYLSDFNAIKSIMSAKYGKPAQDDALWRNEQYKENIGKWGEAVQLGHMVLFAKWYYPNVLIHLQISGEGGKIKLGIQYRKP